MDITNPFSAKPKFSAEKINFGGNFRATLVFMLERKIYFFFLSQLIERFHRIMKKRIGNAAKYELFLPKPLTLTLF